MIDGFVQEVTAAKQVGRPVVMFTSAEVANLRGSRIVEWYTVDVLTQTSTIHSAPVHMFRDGGLGIIVDEIKTRSER